MIRRVGLHTAFWVGCAAIVFFTVLYFESTETAWRLTCALIAPAPLVVYLHLASFDRLFQRKLHLPFALLSAVLVGVSSFGYSRWYHLFFPEPDSHIGSLALVLALIVLSTAARIVVDGMRSNNTEGKGTVETPESGHPGVEVPEFFFFRENKVEYRIPIREILYIRSIGNYAEVHAGNRKVMVQRTLKQLITQLPEKDFMRVHKSFIINLNAIEYIDTGLVKIEREVIPVGRSYSAEFECWLDQRRL